MFWVELDHQLFHFINQTLINPVFDELAPILRNKNTWIPFYVIGAVYLRKRNKAEAVQLVFLTVLAVLLSDQLSGLVKQLVHRLRPCAIGEGRLLLKHCSNSFSFTSNHAANHFAIATMVGAWFRNTALAAVLFLWAAVIAFSQVYVGLHYPADVTAGALLGILVSSLVYVTFELIRITSAKKSTNEF